MLGNVFILGDSYSTFSGFIPDGYDSYYAPEGPKYAQSNDGQGLTDNDVTCVSQTWWHDLVAENGKLLQNNSWSGTTVCNTGYGGSDFSDVSFVGRIKKLIAEGYFKEKRVDTFFLFGGTNDSWFDAPLGEEMDAGWEEKDLFCALPAFSYLVDLLKKHLPDTKFYCIINTGLKDEIVDFYSRICEKYGVVVVRLTDIEKQGGHPTVAGMTAIRLQVLDCINKK